MRLCLISHAYLEEGYRHVLQTLASYPGVELAWVTPERYRLALQNSSGELNETSSDYRTYPLPIRWGGRQGTFVYHSVPLQRALDDFRPDIILHEQEVFAIGGGQIARVAQSRGIPLVMFVNENIHRALALPRRWLRDYVLKRCAGLIPISGGAAQVHRDWGFHGPLAILPQMGVHLNPEPDFQPRDPGTLRVCYAGRLTPIKGVDILLRAVAKLHDAGVPVQCTIAGRGDARESLAELAHDLGIQDRIEFAGMLLPAQVTALLQSNDVLVLPSRRTPTWEEQFGRILVEGMAQAIVTSGSRTGAIPEVIDSEELLFDEDSSEGLALVLQNLARRPEFALAERRRLWERARDQYETSVVTRRKVAFLEEVLQKHRNQQ